MEVKRRARASRDPGGLHAIELEGTYVSLRNEPNYKRKDAACCNILNPRTPNGKTFRKIAFLAVIIGILSVGNELLQRIINPQKERLVVGSRGHIRSHDEQIINSDYNHKHNDNNNNNNKHDTTHVSVHYDKSVDHNEHNNNNKKHVSVHYLMDPPASKFGKMNHALYRFKATKLGPHFANAIQYFDEYIGERPNEIDAAFAHERIAMPHVAEYHQECYHPPNVNKMLYLEEEKKKHKQKKKKTDSGANDSDERKLNFLVEEQAMFYDYAKIDMSSSSNKVQKEQLAHVSSDGKWAWRTAALFGTQYSGSQTDFRDNINSFLVHDKILTGKISGTFWYPPNAIREWHTNKFDVTTKMRHPWRMYYVRVKPAVIEHNAVLDDQSGFHLMEGNGITEERLENLGAYPLTTYNNDGGPSNENVWRVPDKNGYMTLFRLEAGEPYRWHCIVAGEDVHRYSLGMQLSDDDVEALLERIGVEY